jgi:hypothetical protein
MEYSSKFCWLIWIGIAAIIATSFCLWKFLFLRFMPFMPAVLQPFDLALAIVTYVLLVVVLLKTV